jgi:hypothetical protein
MRESGRIIQQTDREFIIVMMVPYMRENGLKI